MENQYARRYTKQVEDQYVKTGMSGMQGPINYADTKDWYVKQMGDRYVKIGKLSRWGTGTFGAVCQAGGGPVF